MTDCANCEYFDRHTHAVGLEDIDPCVRPELEKLWALGIETVCSWCGHGDRAGAFIVVDPKDADRMAELGYERAPEKYGICKDCGVFFRAWKD